MVLCRIVDEVGNSEPGGKGISMFYLRTRKDDGSLNGIQVMHYFLEYVPFCLISSDIKQRLTLHNKVVKLKNKLGTRQLPTGELLLDGAEASLVSDPGRGIPSISSMLTVTRLHNVVSSVAAMRKVVQLARDYATRRSAFGRRLDEHPLHLQTLSRMETEARACTALMLDLAFKLGLDDCGRIGENDALLLRLMMPVAKMYTAKRAVSVVSEGLECFGGQGYIEDTGLPTMFRDAQVLRGK